MCWAGPWLGIGNSASPLGPFAAGRAACEWPQVAWRGAVWYYCHVRRTASRHGCRPALRPWRLPRRDARGDGARSRWDEARQTASLDAQFVPEEASIIRLDDQDIGWMQIAETGGEIFLKQFFIDRRFQRRGIGTGLLHGLIERATQAGKTIALGVVKGNPARSLYERHGFQVISEDQYKVYMARTS